MAEDYTFSVGLLNASPDPNELQVWQSGTLTLDIASPEAVTGALTLPGYYKDPIPFNGSAPAPDTMSGTVILATGQSSEAEITFTISYKYDGFLYDGSYLGGLVSMLDYSAQETYLYVIQGFSPQGPFSTASRESPEPAPE